MQLLRERQSLITDCWIPDQQSVPEVYFPGKQPEWELEACPLLWRTTIKTAWAQRSHGPKGVLAIQETTKALLRGTAALTRGRVRLKDGVNCVTAGSWSNERVLRNIFDPGPAIYHADVIRGPSPMWSSTKTSVFKRAPNKIFLGCSEPWSLCSLEVSHQLDKCGSAA